MTRGEFVIDLTLVAIAVAVCAHVSVIAAAGLAVTILATAVRYRKQLRGTA